MTASEHLTSPLQATAFDTRTLTRLLVVARDLTGPDTDTVNSEYVRGQVNLICDLAGLSSDEYGDLITDVLERRESVEKAIAVIANCEEAKPAEQPPWVVAGVVMNRRDPAYPERVLRTETDPADVRQWGELARHLVQGHGGEPNGLIGNELTLDQIRFAHADTHLALAFINACPPDGHDHPGSLDAGEPTPRLASYFPFWRSRSATADEAFPAPAVTGLPHTGIYHVSFIELADWAAGRFPRRLTSPAAEDDAQWAYWSKKLGVTETTRAEWIKVNAGRASARWLGGISYPAAPAVQGTVLARPAREPSKPAPGQARGRPR